MKNRKSSIGYRFIPIENALLLATYTEELRKKNKEIRELKKENFKLKIKGSG